MSADFMLTCGMVLLTISLGLLFYSVAPSQGEYDREWSFKCTEVWGGEVVTSPGGRTYCKTIKEDK